MSSTQVLDDMQPTEDALLTFSVTATPEAISAIYTLPDTLRNWPYKRMINPHYHTAHAESVAWLESFKPFSPATLKAFSDSNFSLLCAMTFPNASFNDLRDYCDLMHLYFVVDDHTDPCNMENAKTHCEAAMDGVLGPDSPRPQNEPIVGEIARQVWQRASAHASLPTQERFIKVWRGFLDSIIVQASRRDKSHYICTIDEYMSARRDNIGVHGCYAFMEISLRLDIPHYIMEHSTIVALKRDATDMIVLANDMCSYKKEIFEDHADYNAITVVMHNKNTDMAGSLQWISDTYDVLVEHFLMLRKDVFHKTNFPSYGKKLDTQVEAYVDGLGQWVRGLDDWNFASSRYFFDNEGLEIQCSRKLVIA